MGPRIGVFRFRLFNPGAARGYLTAACRRVTLPGAKSNDARGKV
jgi:hypothetical protein